MVLDALKFNPKIAANPFKTERVAFAGNGQETSSSAGIERFDTGKGINEENSTGVIGEVTGTGENGKHRLNTYFWLFL